MALVAVPLFLARSRMWRHQASLNLAIPLLLLCLYHILLLNLPLPVPRYTIPIRPYVFILAVMAFARLWRLLPQYESEPSRVPIQAISAVKHSDV